MSRIRVTRSARKHKIGNARILDAGNPTQLGHDALLYIGKDDRGLELAIIAVPDDKHEGGLAVIHAMPTRFLGEGRDRR